MRKTVKLFLVLTVALAFNANAHAATTTDTTESRIARSLQGLQRFETTHSLDDIQSTVFTLVSALQNGTIKPQDYVARRRAVVGAWAKVLAAIQRSYPPNFDPNDMNDLPTDCVIPPGGNYLCGVDPNAVKNSNLRAQYVAAINANDAKLRLSEQYHRVMVLDMGAMTGLEVNLKTFQEWGAPSDSAALDAILRQAHLSSDRVRKIDSMIRHSQ